MKFEELKNKTVSELYDMLNNFKKELLGFRMQLSISGLQNTSQIRKVRRDIARVMLQLHKIKNGVN